MKDKHSMSSDLWKATYQTHDFCYMLNSGKHEKLCQMMDAVEDVFFEIKKKIKGRKVKPRMYSELMAAEK